MAAFLFVAFVIGLCAAQLKYEEWEALMNVFDAINCTSCPRFSEHDPCPATATQTSGQISAPTLSCQGTVVKGIIVTAQAWGSIPTTIGVLSNLDYFGCTGYVKGTIPTELGKLTALNRLDFSFTSLQSSLPTELGQLTALSLFRLHFPGSIYGTIPSQFGRWTNLNTLELVRTNLTSTLPSTMNRWTRLASLGLYSSPIEGTIPTELVSLTSLRSVAIDETAHTGTIPSQLFTTTVSIPRAILLDCPLLCGSIPTEVGLAQSLTSLTLSGRGLHGDLPSQLWQLTRLASLTLSDAEFQGTLPSDIALLTDLQSFAVRRTNIGGAIPTQLGKLSQLRFLSLMFSKFDGTAPAAILRMPSLEQLFLNNNNLTGSIVAADVSPSITACIVQGYADVADSNCLSSPCVVPCCRVENAACAPRNDDCNYPQLLGDVGATRFSTRNATARTCVGCTSACVIRRDVWFEWHATCAGTASVEICDVDNVALLIYHNSACPPLTGNTGNDSDCNQSAPMAWAHVCNAS